MKYTLITVTKCGFVLVQEGICTIRMAEEAKTSALTGRTIEQQERHDKWLREVYFPTHKCCYIEQDMGTCKFAQIYPEKELQQEERKPQ